MLHPASDASLHPEKELWHPLHLCALCGLMTNVYLCRSRARLGSAASYPVKLANPKIVFGCLQCLVPVCVGLGRQIVDLRLQLYMGWGDKQGPMDSRPYRRSATTQAL